MIKKIEEIFSQFERGLTELTKKQDLLSLKSDFLGKKGRLNEILKSLKDATQEERGKIGPYAQAIKEKIQKGIEDKIYEFEKNEANSTLEKEKIDITYLDSLKALGAPHGGYHPRTIIQREIEDIFLSMGFEVLDGPHVESEYYNFEALNIPSDHPARDMQDTFWLKDENKKFNEKYLLRTHTSTIQIRGMLERKPPFRFIAPGIVFRCERTDASHDMVFSQLEGMMVGKDVSVSHLIYFMKLALSRIFKKDIVVRLRPGFFPFVEPGFELDIQCLICKGKGCSVCKQVGWVELLPCGMVHPNVLKAGNIDPNEYTGFAFGLGFDRLVMMKYAIDHITHLQSGDLRFNSQFKSF